MKTPPILLTCIALAASALSSATAKQEVKIRAMCFKEGFPKTLYAHVPSGSLTVGEVSVKSFLNHETNTLKLDGPELVFTDKSDPVSATDVNEHLGKLDVPAELKSAILLLIPNSTERNDFHCKVIAVDDSSKAFPPGSFKVVNLGKTTVKVVLEKKDYQFEPGEIKLIENPPFGDNQSVSMQAYWKMDGVWQLISSGVWTDPGTRRVLQVFTENPATHTIELKGIRDVVIP